LGQTEKVDPYSTPEAVRYRLRCVGAGIGVGEAILKEKTGMDMAWVNHCCNIELLEIGAIH
jgi:hypothetical protein